MKKQFYVNLGRWADSIVGPFDTYDKANAYIDTTNWRGSRPKVVQIAPPVEKYTEAVIGFGPFEWKYKGSPRTLDEIKRFLVEESRLHALSWESSPTALVDNASERVPA